ncbi:MAG: monovalent cation/H(+) antiporter subunit G [Phycisphaerales bacterium]|nr:MAG: monovalent cation/H(+) antiporter subunit G [Phycisphaerales bacterium]
MRDLLTVLLLFSGGLFSLVAAIGIFRMPDTLTRMQAATKAGTLGVGCMFLSVAIYFDDMGVTVRALLVIAFLFLTAPVAAHMIGRAAYAVGATSVEYNVIDELRDDAEKRHFASRDDDSDPDPPDAGDPPHFHQKTPRPPEDEDKD